MCMYFLVNTYIIQTAGFTYIQIQTCRFPDGCRRGAVTVRFQYLVPQATFSDDSTIYSDSALLDSELGVETRLLPFELGTKSIQADGEETRQSSYNPNRV